MVKRIDKDFTEFVSDLKSGKSNILSLIELTEYDFEEVPDPGLTEFPEFPEHFFQSGTQQRVRIKSDVSVFDLFTTILITSYYYSTEYVFTVTTTDVGEILRISDILIGQLGDGSSYPYLTERTSFRDTELLKLLTGAQMKSEEHSLVTSWDLDKTVLRIVYKPTPFNEFSLSISRERVIKFDRSVRKNGTILDLLTTDIYAIFIGKEDHKQVVTLPGDTEISSVDYHYALGVKELGVFDSVLIKQYTVDKDHSFRSETNVSFRASAGSSAEMKIEAIEKLINLYGGDSDGENDLLAHERDLLEKNEYWEGRDWEFNMDHGLWDRDNTEEINTYSISLFNDTNPFETNNPVLTLTILDYDALCLLHKQ